MYKCFFIIFMLMLLPNQETAGNRSSHSQHKKRGADPDNKADRIPQNFPLFKAQRPIGHPFSCPPGQVAQINRKQRQHAGGKEAEQPLEEYSNIGNFGRND